MKRTTIAALVDYFNGKTITNLDEIKQELQQELDKYKAKKEESAAIYNIAKPYVMAALYNLSIPKTAAEIYEKIRGLVPEKFTPTRLQYGLNKFWADEIVKIECYGAPNKYRLK